MHRALFSILRQYSCLAPPNKIELPTDVPRQALQDFLTERILNSELLSAYPPSTQYQRTFWKKIISHLEANYDEDGDFELSSEIYDHYVEVIQDSQSNAEPLRGRAPSNSYITYYWEPPDELRSNVPGTDSWLTTTLLESRNMIESGTTGLRTWTAAFFMAQYLLHNPDLILNKRILELGSGIGFMGTVVGSLQVLHRTSQTTLPKVWLTDVDDTALSVCRRNIELPCNLSSKHGSIETCKVDWFDALDEHSAPDLGALLREKMDPELIVGSDIVFDPSLVEPLLATVKLAIEDSHRTALFALTVRNETTFSKFLSTARDLELKVEEIPVIPSTHGTIFSSDIIEDMGAVKLLRFSAAAS